MQLTNVLAIRGPITRNTRLNNFTIIILYVCIIFFEILLVGVISA